MADRFRLGTVRLDVVPEHLSHSGHIGTASSQESRCLKGTYPCLRSKIVGVDDNS